MYDVRYEDGKPLTLHPFRLLTDVLGAVSFVPKDTTSPVEDIFIKSIPSLKPGPLNTNTEGNNRFKCGVPGCEKSFTHQVALHQHALATHPIGRPSQLVSPKTNILFKCGVPGCKRSFTQRTALHQHTSDAHPKRHPSQPVILQTSNLFKCDHCGRSYTLQGALAQHKADKHHTRTQDKPAFKCGVPECGRAFETHDELMRHGLALHPKHRSSAPAAVPIHHPVSTPSPIGRRPTVQRMSSEPKQTLNSVAESNDSA